MSKAVACLLLQLVICDAAHAQAAEIFGSGEPPRLQEDKMDRLFSRTRLGLALSTGTQDPACVQLVGAMFALLANAAPYLHKRDGNFFVDPMLAEALKTQLSPRGFPAADYFKLMVRRVLMDGRMPAEWFPTAKSLQMLYPFINLPRLEYLAEEPQLIDSFYLTLPGLIHLHQEEVEKANSLQQKTAEAQFQTDYLDHDVAWGGLTFIDFKKVKGTPSGREAKLEEVAPPKSNAMDPGAMSSNLGNLFQQPKPSPPRRITVQLAAKQYLPSRLPHKGDRVLVRGRLYKFNPSMTEFEIRDGLLFEDPAFTTPLANPRAVAACPMSQNDLTPKQPGGFAH